MKRHLEMLPQKCLTSDLYAISYILITCVTNCFGIFIAKIRYAISYNTK